LESIDQIVMMLNKHSFLWFFDDRPVLRSRYHCWFASNCDCLILPCWFTRFFSVCIRTS